MTFLLPILVAVALNFMGAIDLSSLGELHFGVLENDLSPQTITWLERYGPVTAYGTREELTAAIKEPSTNVIGVRADGDSIKTAISGDELDIFRQAAVTLPALYERRENAEQAEVQVLERPDILESFQGIFIPAVLIVAMFMGCTFNAMNIISEKEDGVAFVNEILPMTPCQYILQKVVVGFLFGSLSSIITACKQEWADGGKAKIQKGYAKLVEKGKMDQAKADGIVAAITAGLKEDLCADCDLIVEAAFEDMKVKQTTFGELDKICKEGCIFASNTSSLSITEIGKGLSRPLIGMHFFNPADRMKLIEVIAGANTPATMEAGVLDRKSVV